MRARVRLCATVGDRDLKTMVRDARRALRGGADLVELRLDYVRKTSGEEIAREVSSLSKSCILTVRSRAEGGRFSGPEDERLGRLLDASRAHPQFIDLELATAERDLHLARELERNCEGLIVSSHCLEGTPPLKELLLLRDRAMKIGEIAKVVASARGPEDNAKIISLYDDGRKTSGRLVAFCMGKRGVISRIIAMMAGSPISYVSVGPNPLAPGQLPLRVAKELLGQLGS